MSGEVMRYCHRGSTSGSHAPPKEITRLNLVPNEKMIMEIKDSNGVLLQTGDSVQIIKDLKVGGSSMVLKRGDVVKNIKIVEGEEEVEGRINGSTIMLKPEFLKKRK